MQIPISPEQREASRKSWEKAPTLDVLYQSLLRQHLLEKQKKVGMKFEEILAEIRKGRKARRKKWGPYFITISESGEIIDSDGDSRLITGMEINADDWELVPETKKFKSWVKLYDNGSVFGYDSLEKAMESVSLAEYDGKSKLVETRIIEWEAPE